MPDQERKSWRAWALIVNGGEFYVAKKYRPLVECIAHPGDRIVRVTITVDETKKKKGKVGRG